MPGLSRHLREGEGWSWGILPVCSYAMCVGQGGVEGNMPRVPYVSRARIFMGNILVNFIGGAIVFPTGFSYTDDCLLTGGWCSILTECTYRNRWPQGWKTRVELPVEFIPLRTGSLTNSGTAVGHRMIHIHGGTPMYCCWLASPAVTSSVV